MKQFMNNILMILIAGICLYSNLAHSETRSGLSGTVKVLAGNWKGENKNSGTEFEASDGRQWSISLTYQYADFYTGLNLQGGVYTFDDNGPEQMSGSTSQPVSNVELAHSEIDLVAGYFINRQISVFLDLKGISNTWENYSHEQTFGGVGLGATGLWPLNPDWILYGSIGFVPAGDVMVNDVKVGEGKSSAFDIGAMYNLDEGQRLIFGLKASTQIYNFDSGDEQLHEFSGLFLGYSHSFFFH